MTLHPFGAGAAAYLAACFEPRGLDALLEALLPRLGVAVPQARFPLVVRTGRNGAGRTVDFYGNYSAAPLTFTPVRPGRLLPDGGRAEGPLTLGPWDALFLEAD